LARRIIKIFKYRYVKDIGYELEPLFRKFFVKYKNLLDLENAVLIPVPLYWYKECDRGFNQAEELAKVIGKILGIPIENKLAFKKKSKIRRSWKGRSGTPISLAIFLFAAARPTSPVLRMKLRNGTARLRRISQKILSLLMTSLLPAPPSANSPLFYCRPARKIFKSSLWLVANLSLFQREARRDFYVLLLPLR